MNECDCPNIYTSLEQNIQDKYNKTKNILKFLRDEFVYGGHLLSLGCSAFAISIILMLNATFKFELIFITYLLSLIVYNFDHYKSVKEDKHDNPKRTNHIMKYQNFFPILLTIYGSLFIALLLVYGNILSLSIGILILIIGILYSIGLKNLTKKITGFKNIYTSLSVSLLVVLISFHVGLSLNLTALFIGLFIFLRLLINSSFCDLKDMKTDKKKELKTFPIYFGKKKFLSFLHVLNFISLLCVILGILLDILPIFSLFLVLTYPIVIFYINKAKKSNVNIENLSSGLVDGEFIFWPILLFLGAIFIS